MFHPRFPSGVNELCCGLLVRCIQLLFEGFIVKSANPTPDFFVIGTNTPVRTLKTEVLICDVVKALVSVGIGCHINQPMPCGTIITISLSVIGKLLLGKGLIGLAG